MCYGSDGIGGRVAEMMQGLAFLVKALLVGAAISLGFLLLVFAGVVRMWAQ